MKKNIFFFALALIISLLNPISIFATHIMGGNLYYQNLGVNGGSVTFKVTLKMYRYCAPGSSPLPQDMNLGVYKQDQNNPNANKILFLSTTLQLVNQQFITPPNANDTCSFTPNECVEEGIYEETIIVDTTGGGYQLIVERCCRNGNIVNVFNALDVGLAYYAFIPPTNIINSSPTFAVAPVPYICALDTVSILNSAVDPDGDLLIYNFVWPYAGISTGGNSNPNPSPVYNWPINEITYEPGYSVAQPFGVGGYTAIDTLTGLTSYLSPLPGFYVVAVEIKEYRNGVLIGISRRDLQLIFITCPVNPAPVLSNTTPQTTYTVQAGQQLCFNITFTDPNADSLFFNTSGNIFNGALVNPPAVLPGTTGLSTVTSQFCWTPSCAQGSTNPYNFSVIVNDNGCPAKTTNVVYTINVVPFVGVQQINGPDSICGNALNGVVYTAPGLNNSTYNWAIAGGSIVNGGNTNTITVNWNLNGLHTLTVTEISANGCPGAPYTFTVNIGAVPAAIAGLDKTYCSGASAIIGSNAVPGVVYSWSPATGLSSTTISNPVVTLTNGTQAPINNSIILTTSLNGCANADTVLVIVNPTALSNAGNNQFLCSANTLNLGTANNPNYTYAWSPALGLNSTSISNPTLTLVNNGNTPFNTTYAVVTNNVYGCSTSDTVTVTVNPVPTANAGGDIIFCSGQSGQIGVTATSGYTYSWSPALGLNLSTASDPTVTLTNSGTVPVTNTYVVTTSWFGCAKYDTVLVTVKPNPISNAGANLSICSGDTITLGTANTNGYTYAWTPAVGLSSTTVSNPTIVFSNTTNNPVTYGYTVTTTLNGCITSDSVAIIVNPLPTVVPAANPTTICVGQTAALTAVGANIYSWANSLNPGSPIGTGSPFNVSPLITTTYIVTGTSSANCKNTSTITVFVNPLPSVAAIAVPDSICQGDSILITGSGANTYQWALLLTPGTVFDTTGAIVVSPMTTTSYIVTGTDGNGCINKDTITIKVNPAATVANIIGTLSVCPGITGLTYYVPNATPSSTYQWTITGGTITSGQGNDSILVDWGPAGVGIITVVETTNLGCSSDVVGISIIINPLLTPAMPYGDTVLCANEAQGIIYNALNTPGSIYTWFASVGGNVVSGNGTSTITLDWTIPGLTTVYLWYEESTVADTICFGTSDTLAITILPVPQTSAIQGVQQLCIYDTSAFSVTNSVGSTYQWIATNGTVATGQGTNTTTVFWNASGNQNLAVIETNSYGCVGDTINYTPLINPLPNANAGSDVAICIGKDVQLNASGGTVYNWNPSVGLSNPNISNPLTNPTSTTTYTVLVTDTNGCKKADSVLVTVNPLPIVTCFPSSPAICIGTSTTLNATGGLIYQWSPNYALDDSTLSNPTANPTVTTTYTVIVTDLNTCSSSASLTLVVNALPIITAGTDVLICNGASTTLTASGGITYVWSPSVGLNATTGNPVAANPTTQTTYTVTGTDANGCSNTDEVIIDINPQPEASFTGEYSVSCKGILGKFTNTSINALNYIWWLDDGLTSTDINTEHLYNFGQAATITLIAINGICSDTISVPNDVLSLADYLKDIPNIFTPNGDGLNDCFALPKKFDFADCFTMSIYNRWGNKMFETSSTEKCWNGDNLQNAACPSGTYFYVIKIKEMQISKPLQLMR